MTIAGVLGLARNARAVELMVQRDFFFLDDAVLLRFACLQTHFALELLC